MIHRSGTSRLIFGLAIFILIVPIASRLWGAPVIDFSKLTIKLSGGVNDFRNGDFNRYVELMNAFYGSYRPNTTSLLQKFNSGWEGWGEVYVPLAPKLSLGLGCGYIQAKKLENTLANDYGRNRNPPIVYTLSYVLDTKVSAVPVTLSLSYVWGESDAIFLYATAGGGYYFGRWNNTINYNYQYISYRYAAKTAETASAGAFGFHGGIGLEWKIAGRFSLFFEGFGRYAKISGFEGNRITTVQGSRTESTVHGTLYFYEHKYNAQYWETLLSIANGLSGDNYRNVREAVVDFSGWTFRIGWMVRL